ncbi:MAG: hypothetical protein LBV12_12345 [Puniceicoccales bacterium]|jgi:hypothetical protein|nr:hypothetical protein [Puniceicoccales bacterium]
MKKELLPTATLLFIASSANAAVTYVDATLTNTFLADGTPLQSQSNIPSLGDPYHWVWETSDGGANGDHWKLRNGFGNGSTIFSSGDYNASNSAPTLMTMITGLESGAIYDIYVYFWAITTGSTWQVLAGEKANALTNYSGGENGNSRLMSVNNNNTALGTAEYSTTHFTSPVLVGEGNRRLYEASLGSFIADASGSSLFILMITILAAMPIALGMTVLAMR